MNVQLINGNIICFIAQTQYEMTSTFVRMGEFYESPYPNILNKFFTLDEFMDTYSANNDDKLEYFDYWQGYNFPGSTLLQFIDAFKYNLRPKELYVVDMIKRNVDLNSSFYVIASVGNIALNHEYAHAQYYLNIEYKEQCEKIYNNMSKKSRNIIETYLTDNGYNEFTFGDETQAYLGTNTNKEMFDSFSIPNIITLLPAIKEYRKLFQNIPKMIIKPL